VSNEFLGNLLKWFAISVSAGMAFNVGWAVVFWNSDALFIYHWLSVPITMMVMTYGCVRSFR
jgi:hypothetical protein